jgi:CIC family chloride channel protein
MSFARDRGDIRNIRYLLAIAASGLLTGTLLSIFYYSFNYLWSKVMPVMQSSSRFIFLFTMLGLALSFILIYSFTPSRFTQSGTHVILEKYHLNSGQINAKETTVNVFASFFTLALGGAAGLDGPSVVLGGGISSISSRIMKFPTDMRKRNFLAGVAAGLASIFKAPLTAILFALEIPYKRDLEREAYVEVAIAAVSSYLITVTLLGPQSIFGVSVSLPQLRLSTIATTILLALICGAYAFFFVRTYNLADALAKRFFVRGGFGLLLLAGGLLLGAIGYLDFNSLGPGYNVVYLLVSGSGAYTLTGLALLLVLRLLSTTITLNFGGTGGLLIPSVVEGSVIGSIFSLVLFGNINPLYVAVGIAAMIAASHKVILTPIAFVAETLGPAVIVPAVLASVFSNFVSGAQSFFPTQPYSKYKEEELALERIYGKVAKSAPSILAALTAADVMTRNPIAISGEDTLEEALKVFEKVPYRVLPVVDSFGRPISTVKLEDIASAPSRLLKMQVSTMYSEIPLTVSPSTPLEDIIKTIIETGKDHVFVVDEDYRLVGVIAAIDIAKKLVHYYSVY